MDLISREAVANELEKHKYSNEYCVLHNIDEAMDMGMVRISVNTVPSAFEGMTNNEVHKAIFGFELDPRYLVTDDNCIVGGEDCPACPLYNKICNNRNFAEWLDSPYKGVSE